MFSRKEIALKAGVGFDTLRYYEKMGLLETPVRNEKGYRQYHEGVMERLIYIVLAKKCGFTLREIKKSLDLLDVNQNTKIDTDGLIESKIREIDEKIELLGIMKEKLRTIKEPLKMRDCERILSIAKKE